MIRDAYGRLHENSYPSTHRLGPHSPTTPWAMHLADDNGDYRALCFDFDGKDSTGTDPDLMERAHDDCDHLATQLEQLAIAHVVCQSSGTGGRHIWITLTTGAPAAQIALLARAARSHYRSLDHGMLLNPRTGAARPPLSPHRDGSTSTILRGSTEQLTHASTTLEQLTALTAALTETMPALRSTDSAPSGPVDPHHQTHRPLSRAGIAHMATLGGGSNPSWTGFMCLLAAANAGWTFADIQHAAHTAPGMEHYRSKNTGRGGRRPRTTADSQDRLTRQWDKAQQYAATQRPLPAPTEPANLSTLTRILDDTDALLHTLHSSPGRWGHGEAAHSQRSILTALAYLTLQTGKHTIAASIRDLALMTGLGRTTAATALTRLADTGIIHRTTPSDAGNAAEWQLTPTFSTTHRTVRSQPLNNPRPPTEIYTHRAELIRILEDQLTDQRHDLFTRHGIGHTAGQLYALLHRTGALTISSAARLLGVTIRHATTLLSRLRTHRLVTRHPSGWARSARDLRNYAARALGVSGTLTARATAYQNERTIWQWWQAELSTMTSPPHRRPRRPHVTSRTLDNQTSPRGERLWPRYPRDADGRADHYDAKLWLESGMLAPGSLWWSSAA